MGSCIAWLAMAHMRRLRLLLPPACAASCHARSEVLNAALLQVLAAAASNVAVDNLTERLGAALPLGTVVRTGHVARVLPQVHPQLTLHGLHHLAANAAVT